MLGEQRLLVALKRQGRHRTSAGLVAPPGAGPGPAPPRPQGATLGRPGHRHWAPAHRVDSAPPDDPASYAVAAATLAGSATLRSTRSRNGAAGSAVIVNVDRADFIHIPADRETGLTPTTTPRYATSTRAG
jgi:hypothetical protein